MGEEDIVDPRVVPRWVPAGVSGVPRARDWDAVVAVDVPELTGDAAEELSFRVDENGVVAAEDGAAPGAALERLATALSRAVAPPFEARATRRDRLGWSAAARHLRSRAAELPLELRATELAIALTPGGERVVLVDGEELEHLDGPLAAAAGELERRGREQHASFVARATRPPGGRWEVVVDPL